MYQDISKLVEKLQAKRREPILLVGDFMLDEYLFGDTDRISPEAPIPILKVVDRKRCLGGAGSVGASLAGLGAETLCAGIVGDDEAGETILHMLKESGADVSTMVKSKTIASTVKQRMIGLAQHRNRQQLLRVDMEDDGAIGEDLIEEVKSTIRPTLDKIKLIAIEDYNKGLFGSLTLLRWLIGEAKKRKLPVVVDPARMVDYGRYRGAGIITPNRAETSQASGMTIKTVENAVAAGKSLCERFDLEAVLVKLDRDGMVIVNKNSFEAIPTRPLEVFDNTGAGDVVLACLAMGIAEGFSVRDSAILANVGGGWEVQQAGVRPISREQLAFELLQQNRRHTGKLIGKTELLRELDILRGGGKKIVFTNGCFDLLHPGHVSYLEFAREQGDCLVVGINSDKSARSLDDGESPLLNEMERARMLAALEAVDYVVIFDEASVLDLVKDIRPEILVKGDNYSIENVVGHEFVTSYGGKVALAPIEKQYSKIKIIQTILERYKK
jgi:D-beta-D-heptose 7-phosphate kinase/D-beta-D-heptose 1-phosphate adenosyltransferase